MAKPVAYSAAIESRSAAAAIASRSVTRGRVAHVVLDGLVEAAGARPARIAA